MTVHRKILVVTLVALALVCTATFLGFRTEPATATGQEQPAVEATGTDAASIDPAAQPTGPTAERVQELTSLRTATSKTYELADGKREWVGYGEAVHYKDTNGVFQEIDDSIVSDVAQIGGSSYTYRNGANAFTARFGASAADTRLIRLEYQGTSVAFGPAEATAVRAAKTANVNSKALSDMTYGENLVGYPGIYPGVDLFYELKTYGIKEYLTLRQPNTKNEFAFNLVLSGLTPKRAEDGRITLVNAKGETLFWLGQPIAVDNAGVASRDVTYALSGSDGAYTLTVTVSPTYLSDPNRAYPVIVDPDLLITGTADTYDTYVSSRYPDTTYTYNTYLRTGRDSDYYTRRTYLRFDLSNASGIDTNTIDQAYVRLEKYSGATPAITAYRNTGSWSSGTVTWNTMPSYTTSECSTQATNDSGSWWRMYNLTVVKKWLNGTYSQYGWMIKDATEAGTTQWTTFYACDAPSPHKPELHIVYIYCGPRPYEQENRVGVNCAGYALNLDYSPSFMNSQDLQGYTSTSSMLSFSWSKLHTYLQNNDLWYQDISGYQSDISSGYYRVVMRVGWRDMNGDGDYDPSVDLFDYHFWYQTKTGAWADKFGQDVSEHSPATDAWSDPENYNWIWWSQDHEVHYDYFYDSNANYLGRYWTGA